MSRTPRPWATQRLEVDKRGRVARVVVHQTSAELSADLELMRVDLADALAFLHSAHPERAVPLLVRNHIPTTYTKETP